MRHERCEGKQPAPSIAIVGGDLERVDLEDTKDVVNFVLREPFRKPARDPEISHHVVLDLLPVHLISFVLHMIHHALDM
jgi:hypothetical protein